jgi:hypothetical protein
MPRTTAWRSSPASNSIFRLTVIALAAALGGCATTQAESFIRQYGLQANVGPLYELVAQERTVGWLYGAVHYGTAERPSLSQAAARAIAQTQHVYLEQTDRAGSSWPMRNAVAEDLKAIVNAKRKAAFASADRVRQGIIAAQKMERDSGGVAVVLTGDASYFENWALAHNHCGSFYEFGTERLVRVLATGTAITVHSLETEASRQSALENARDKRCQANGPDKPPSPADGLAGQSIDAICKMILRDVALDQVEGRPHDLSAAAACVVDGRHRTMVARIVNATQAGEKPFVIVGRGHLMPGQTLTGLLEAQGLALRRID